ncbi:Hypothetical predicted protein [Octopus vulgaris]|uniref:Uncharacterized protein n=1 Tax=Octopus vulgaris TaxID=6645 RepID=A0AA36F0F0_OCTVU|nr:Hypothetical predicted protein [Octopus vulgaris]
MSSNVTIEVTSHKEKVSVVRQRENTQEQDMKEKEVLDNFRKILPRDSEDYLDFLLIEESQILSDYLSLLEHV